MTWSDGGNARDSYAGNEMTRAGRGTLPAELRAAGLIVPEPSIKLLPIPFNGVETGCGAEYMMVMGDDDGKMRVGWVEEGGWWWWLKV